MEGAPAFVLYPTLAKLVEVAYHVHDAGRVLYFLNRQFVNHSLKNLSYTKSLTRAQAHVWIRCRQPAPF
jgi:hypothetical protein